MKKIVLLFIALALALVLLASCGSGAPEGMKSVTVKGEPFILYVPEGFSDNTASGIDAPVGLKNPMSGNIIALINSIFAAQSPQIFKYRNYQVSSNGNPYAHAILRGGVDASGADVPNFHYETVMQLTEMYKGSKLENPAIIIDTNHSNSGKKFKQQVRIAHEVMHNRCFDAEFKKMVKGFMIESFLVEGNQAHDDVFGKSITDPCLGWEDTERLLFNIAEQV